jgi:hypothetical protein
VRARAPFLVDDLAELDALLSRADAVVAMQEVHDGNRDPNTIGLRHDLDAGHALATGVRIAEWEAERGYRATFYMLHTSPYWTTTEFPHACDRIASLGHEIGIHADALAESFKTGRHPDAILSDAIAKLRTLGHEVRGVAGHGNPLCNRDRREGEITFANDEQFTECARPQEGPPDREIYRGQYDRTLTLDPKPLAYFGLEYEALVLGLPKPWRISDSGGKWLNPGWDETVDRWATRNDVVGRQLHFLWHPDWWSRAFTHQAVAA